MIKPIDSINDEWSSTAEVLQQMSNKLLAVESLCRRYNTAAVNCGAHELAGKVLEILTSPRAAEGE